MRVISEFTFLSHDQSFPCQLFPKNIWEIQVVFHLGCRVSYMEADIGTTVLQLRIFSDLTAQRRQLHRSSLRIFLLIKTTSVAI
jgi:hypothetical protein